MFDELIYFEIAKFMPFIHRVSTMAVLCRASRSVIPQKEINILRTMSYADDDLIKALIICKTEEKQSILVVFRKLHIHDWSIIINWIINKDLSAAFTILCNSLNDANVIIKYYKLLHYSTHIKTNNHKMFGAFIKNIGVKYKTMCPTVIKDTIAAQNDCFDAVINAGCFDNEENLKALMIKIDSLDTSKTYAYKIFLRYFNRFSAEDREDLIKILFTHLE